MLHENYRNSGLNYINNLSKGWSIVEANKMSSTNSLLIMI